MREIKFRGWDAKKQAMYNLHHLEWPLAGGNWESARASQPDTNGEYWMTHLLPRRDALMQFTGLKDKNGKDIYEGDIVAVHEPQIDEDIPASTFHQVKWFGDGGYPAFDLSPWDQDETNGFSYIIQSGDYEMEVVGNIHENPELLK